MNNNIFKIALAIICLLHYGQMLATQTLQEATDSIKNILELAKKGDSSAQNEVGGWYYRGRHVTQDYGEALQWWSKSAMQGNANAIGNMGLCYQTGNGIKADSLKASQLYIRSIQDGNKALLSRLDQEAKNGCIFSNMLIASCYQIGIGVKKDPLKAIPYLENAAKKNCIEAQNDLGLLLLMANRQTEALNWFKTGMSNKNFKSTYYYGRMLLEGIGTIQDKSAGANYILKAAVDGYPYAMYVAGNCYMTGNGLTQSTEQAFKWYQLAAYNRIKPAQWELANCHRVGKGVDINYERALHWYAEHEANGSKKSFKTLIADSIPDSPFIIYLKGLKQYQNNNYKDAITLFKAVEKKKIIEGKIMQAMILADPNYPESNVKKAIKILQETSKNNALSLYILGKIYEAGNGVDRNIDLAIECFNKASDIGYAKADCALGDLYYEGRGVDQDYNKAVELYAKALQSGDITKEAVRRYALCLENGLGCLSSDKKKADEILKSYSTDNISLLLKSIE